MILCEHTDTNGESLEKKQLIDMGMRKRHWCSWCGATWYTASKRTKYFETYDEIDRFHNYTQAVALSFLMFWFMFLFGPMAVIGFIVPAGFVLANVHNAYKEYRISNRMIKAIE